MNADNKCYVSCCTVLSFMCYTVLYLYCKVCTVFFSVPLLPLKVQIIIPYEKFF